MVNKHLINVNDFKTLGFRTKTDALQFIKINNIRSSRNQTTEDFIDKIKQVININQSVNDDEIKKQEYEQYLINSLNEFSQNEDPERELKLYLREQDDETTEYNRLDLIKFFKIIMAELNNEQIVIEPSIGQIVTLSEQNIGSLIKSLKDIQVNMTSSNSWDEFAEIIDSAEFITLKNAHVKIIDDDDEKEFKKIRGKLSSGYFPYKHNTHFDFTRYGIFSTITSKDLEDNCFYNALKFGGLEEVKLNEIKYFIKNRYISIDNIKKACELLKICVKLTHNKKNGEMTHKIFGNEKDITFNMGSICNHYFVNEITEYTSFSIKNYHDVKDIKECNKIWKMKKGKYEKSNKHFISSYDLINALLRTDLLEKNEITEELMNSNYYTKHENDEIINLNYDVEQMRENEICPKEKIEKIEYINVYADFETDPNGTHKAYLICAVDENDNKYSFNIKRDGEHFVKKFLQQFKTNINIIFHNAKYDFKFLFKYLIIENYIDNNNKFMGCNAFFKNNNKTIKIKVSCSLLLIPFGIGKFNKIFDKDYYENKKDPNYNQKEIMPYKLYTLENVQKKFIKIEEAFKYISDEKKKEQFINNIEKWKVGYQKENEQYFDIIEYSKKYCELDCKILKWGYNIFRGWFLELFNLDINNYISIPSIAQDYLTNEGCYEGIYKLHGIPREFINRCVVGGRTMCEQNKKSKCNKTLNDYDAVNLYGSAMVRLKGFLKGLPKVIQKDQLNKEFLSRQDGYFIKIKVLDVGVRRKMPLLSYKLNDVRMFSNDLKNQIIYVDNIALEDFETFQNGTYEILQGYYFNEGFNPKIKEVVQNLTETRNKFKKEGNPAQEAIKLLVNSSYGRTIMKPISKEIKIFNTTEEYNTFVRRNFNQIGSIDIISGNEKDKYCKRKVEVTQAIYIHQSIPHVGVQILSMSKRIMNEVICLAEDNKIRIYYQDTDSMHIEDNKVKLLSKLFNDKYGRELTGKNLGQFHCDFADWKKAKMDTKEGQLNDIVSVKSLFLGKKAYIDVLRGTNNEGEYEYDYHMRLKGISESSILQKCKDLNKTPYELYDIMYSKKTYYQDGIKYENGEIIFDLCTETKSVFKFDRNFNIRSLDKFERKVTFN